MSGRPRRENAGVAANKYDGGEVRQRTVEGEARRAEAAAAEREELDAAAERLLSTLHKVELEGAVGPDGTPAIALVFTGDGMTPGECEVLKGLLVGPDKLVKPQNHECWEVRTKKQARARALPPPCVCVCVSLCSISLSPPTLKPFHSPPLNNNTSTNHRSKPSCRSL